MNLFNRIVILLLCLLALGGGGAALLVLAGIVAPDRFSGFPGTGDLPLRLAEMAGAARGRAILIATLAVTAALALLLVELWPRRRERRLLLERSGQGAVTVALDGVRDLAARAAAGIAGVSEARAQVRHDAKGLRIRCRVVVSPDASVPELTRALQERVKGAVEHHLGQPVAEVSVEARSATALDRRPPARVR
jgi:uncharacterized alkaline shock family protein YloU